jgi:ABC-type phosphate transport system substrate-binding protein
MRISRGAPLHMTRINLRPRAKKAGAVAAVAVVGATALMSFAGGTAGADPKQLNAALVGTGSDTTQDIMNALAGEANGKLYTPIRSSQASGFRQIISFDAVGSACITPRAPGSSFDRPNGSSNGRDSLSQAVKPGATGWDASGVTCTTAPKNVSGLIDFARSSSGITSTTGDLTYIPFGRDALSYAYYTPAGVTPVTNLTQAQLTSLHTDASGSAEITVGGTRVIACRIQQGSGTFASWNSKVGSPTQPVLDTSTGECPIDPAINGLQENDGSALVNAGRAVNAARPTPDTMVVIGFSAANYISQANGVAKSDLPALNAGETFNLGGIDGLGVPYSGTAPTLTPATAFYASTTWGRDVYNILPTNRAVGIGFAAEKSLFVGTGSAICSSAAQATVNAFGFSSTLSAGTTCGSTTLRRSFT